MDTSDYWRKLLDIDRPLPADFLDRYRHWQRYFRPLVFGVVNVFLRLYCCEKIKGLENIPEKPPYIIAPNHASAIDYVAVAWPMGKRREELYTLTTSYFYDKFWSNFWIKAGANAVRIDTYENFFPALRAAAKVLKAGKSVYINPEGTWSPDGKLLPFRTGVGVLAVETGVPVVPVYLSGTGKVIPPNKIFPRPHPISVTFGKPILMDQYIEKKKSVQAYDVYREATDELRKRIEEMM
jgi:1-acyl-sn-glycerol-3-phosphate acyltransferase